ncbi:MAG TPA: cytochrome P450 [Candidatus Binataceae bacterium]|nr:cytochrome P450 [Candidatus Binataceae bacterium]
MNLSDINLMDQDTFVERVPHEWFTYLRHNAPVYLHPEPANGPGFWVVTRYDDVVAVGRDGQTFSSDQARGGVVALDEAESREQLSNEGRMMLTMDAPDHTRYRSLVNKGFTPRMINMLHAPIRAMVTDILDRALEKRECDFVTEIAAELPLQVIAQMLGVPYEDRHKLFAWSNKMIGSKDPEYSVSNDEARGAAIEMYMYSNELARRRRAEPKDDIVTALLNADINGDRLSEMDFDLFFLLLAVAGNETTRNALSHGMLALMEHPDQYRMMAADPTLVPSAVEEILRWASPVMYFRRNVMRDTEIGGQSIKAGSKVTIWYVSANRDETVFEDPFSFNIKRTPNEHVAFGGGGPHFCLGANLARMEMTIMFDELVRRVDSVAQIGDLKRLRSNFVNGIKHMPVRLKAASHRTAA